MPDIRRAATLPKPDGRGRVRPFVGKTIEGRKARFTVGDRNTSTAESERRLEVIRLLYEKQCERHQCDFWWEGWRRLAVRIGNGETITDASFADDTSPNPPRFKAMMVSTLQSWGIPVAVTEPHVVSQGIEVYRAEIAEMVQGLVAQEVAKLKSSHGDVIEVARTSLPHDPMTLMETATFHQVIDARSSHLEATGDRDENGRLKTRVLKCKDRLKYLRQSHSDFPLYHLEKPKLEELVAYWRNRPTTAKGTRCAREHARDMLQELWRLLGWVSDHPNYRWDWPKGSNQIKKTPMKLPQDEITEAFQTTTKQTYTPEQLSFIAAEADELGKAIIGVAVNCAFGASEVGQWPIKRYILFQVHPHADKLNIETTAEDSWIVGNRPKTGIYGEHLLWSQVALAVRAFVGDGRPVLPMTKQDTPWYRTYSTNPQSKFTRWWSALVKRTQKRHPSLPALPFGSLRDTLPDVIRRDYADDVASLALQHGSLSEDSLLKCYANLPFGRLFSATRELENEFEPFLKVLSGERG